MQNTYTKEREQDMQSNRDKGSEIQSALKQGEDRARGILSDVEKKVKKGEEQIEHVISDVDRRLRQDPWPVVAGIGVSCILLGFIMGITKRH